MGTRTVGDKVTTRKKEVGQVANANTGVQAPRMASSARPGMQVGMVAFDTVHQTARTPPRRAGPLPRRLRMQIVAVSLIGE